MAGLEGKYLTFFLGNEEYGIGILKVKEIIGMMPVVQLSQAPEYVRGVINLRGAVIPVLDLRVRFEMAEHEDTDKTCIIVVEGYKSSMPRCWEMKNCDKKDCPGYEAVDLRCWLISGTRCRNEIQASYYQKKEACATCNVFLESRRDNALFVQGIVVDSVSEVVTISGEDIEKPPELGVRLDSGLILGMAKAGKGVKMLLNIDRILNADDMKLAKEI